MRTVSADSFTDEKTGKSYFRAEILVPEAELNRVRSVLGQGEPAATLVVKDRHGIAALSTLDTLRINGLGAPRGAAAAERPPDGEIVTHKTDWFNLTDAQLQLRPYTHPTMELAVEAAARPAGLEGATGSAPRGTGSPQRDKALSDLQDAKLKGKPVSVIATSMDEPDEEGLHH